VGITRRKTSNLTGNIARDPAFEEKANIWLELSRNMKRSIYLRKFSLKITLPAGSDKLKDSLVRSTAVIYGWIT